MRNTSNQRSFFWRITIPLMAFVFLASACSDDPTPANNNANNAGQNDTGLHDTSQNEDASEPEDTSQNEDANEPEDTEEPEDVNEPEDTEEPEDVNEPEDTEDPEDTEPGQCALRNNALRQSLRARFQSDHITYSYSEAREHMLGTIDNFNGQAECIYTGFKYTTDGGSGHNHNTMNTEHTWPQSRGAGSEPARSDIHHLFPAKSTANSKRGNLEFGVVPSPTWSDSGSKYGPGIDGQTRFEPRDISKGNIARALFYFAVVYDHEISPVEEAALRAWHIADPVDAAERARNDAVAAYQGSRNPFIDNPSLVDCIDDF